MLSLHQGPSPEALSPIARRNGYAIILQIYGDIGLMFRCLAGITQSLATITRRQIPVLCLWWTL